MKRLILSFDAGGIRPLEIAGTVLDKMEQKTQALARDSASIIAGTSGGSIVAALVASGYSGAEIRDLGRKKGQQVFKRSWWHRIKTANGYWGSKYPIEGLHQLLKEELGEGTIGKVDTPLIIPTTDLLTNEAIFIKSHRGDFMDIPLADAAAMSSAAPFFFPPFQGRFADGGFHSYAPILSALGEARYLWPQDTFAILSIGSGASEPTKNPTTNNPVTKLKDIVGAGLSAGVRSDHWIAEWFSWRDSTQLYRIEPDISEPMDAADADTLNRIRAATQHQLWTNPDWKAFLANGLQDL